MPAVTVQGARFLALNEVRAIVGLPKSDTDPIPGVADAVRRLQSALPPSITSEDAISLLDDCASADEVERRRKRARERLALRRTP